MTTSASAAARALVSAGVAPISAAACCACSACLAEMVTSCPARLIDVASALPTLPAPMIATFMVVICSFRGDWHPPILFACSQHYAGWIGSCQYLLADGILPP